MVLYIGYPDQQYFFSQMAQETNNEFEFLDTSIYELHEICEEVIEKAFPIVIINVEEYKDSIGRIIEATQKIRKMTNCRIIIHARGFSPESNLIQSFYNAGYSDFITSPVHNSAFEQFKKCISGEYEKMGASEEILEASKKSYADRQLTPEEDISLQQIKEAQTPHITIGVTGTRHYIGTTTQAMQIVKFFQYAGKKACLIEVNTGESYFRNTMEDFEESEYTYIEELEKITLNNVEIYCNAEKITKAIQKKYDYLVYDYGCYKDEKFQSASYFDRDILVMVGGSKGNEYEPTFEFIKRTQDLNNMIYMFSFVPNREKESILTGMSKVKERVIFPAYSPDIFAYAPQNKYEQLFNISLDEEEVAPKKKKFSLFRRK